MTAPSTDTDRLVFAPEGKAWIDGYDRWTGTWEDVGEAAAERDQSKVHYPQHDDSGSQVVRVPADEPASKADLMKLAADVEELRSDNHWLRTALQMVAAGIGAYLDPRRGDLSRFDVPADKFETPAGPDNVGGAADARI